MIKLENTLRVSKSPFLGLGGTHLTKLPYFPQKLFQNLLTSATARAINKGVPRGNKKKKRKEENKND